MMFHSTRQKRQRRAGCFALAFGVLTLPFPPVRLAAQPALKPPATAALGRRYEYKLLGGQPLALFVEPPAKLSSRPWPALIYFHGGGWTTGTIDQFDRQVKYLAGRGVAGIQVQYRLVAADDPIDPSIQDARSAMRWVRSHAAELGIDPERIGAFGASAGGQLAAFLGMMDGEDDPADDRSVSARANLMVLFNPAIDLGPDSRSLKHGGKDYKALSPLYHVRSGLPPSLVFQGTKDPMVSPAMIAGFVDRMKRAGNDCRLESYPNAGHGFASKAESFYKTLEQVDTFLGANGWVAGSPDLEAIRKLPPLPITPF